MPIHPVVDYSEAPAYYLAKELNNILDMLLPLPNAFNVTNSLQLMNEVSDIPFTTELHLASLDMTDMYSNIPTDDNEHIIRSMCVYQDINTELMSEILATTKIILSQNYYGYNERTYVQPKGLAMGSPPLLRPFQVIHTTYGTHESHPHPDQTPHRGLFPLCGRHSSYIQQTSNRHRRRTLLLQQLLSELEIHTRMRERQ